ncbi:unnamed protein product, partial [Oikopleura dioica]
KSVAGVFELQKLQKKS